MTELAKTSVRLDAKLLKKIRIFCLEKDVSFNAFCVHAMKYCLEKEILPETGEEE